MSESIPVNADVLRWARESLQLTQGDVGERMKKSVEEIAAWERGESSPTYVQLETLAYDIYKRPLALFFFPEPPEEETIQQTFRTLPEFELERIPSRIRFLLRKARVLQLNLAELYDGLNPAAQKVIHDLTFSPSVSATSMATRVREYFGIALSQQQSWRGADDALKRWRAVLEDRGIFVFKDSFNEQGKTRSLNLLGPFSGFCLYDPEFPIIYVNNNMPKTRQAFTMFHELAHLLMQTGGVDASDEDYIQHMDGDNKRIEVLCNQFAAEFLVPRRDFEDRSAGERIDNSMIENWANLYCVSRETILRRLFDQRRIDQSYYDSMVRQWSESQAGAGGPGGDYYNNKGAYLGGRYIEAVFRRYHQGRISVDQVADYLGEKVEMCIVWRNGYLDTGRRPDDLRV
ncbi:MAG: ImmA/IrrE family metallo-endopeptidase [Candidatus Competibacteraceae bacterium]|nr:ImmA/IrrE family metallo-endopeptidase [Candidatus Competibacteraceae bacterium]